MRKINKCHHKKNNQFNTKNNIWLKLKFQKNIIYIIFIFPIKNLLEKIILVVYLETILLKLGKE